MELFAPEQVTPTGEPVPRLMASAIEISRKLLRSTRSVKALVLPSDDHTASVVLCQRAVPMTSAPVGALSVFDAATVPKPEA